MTRPSFMRAIQGEAGNLTHLYWAVKSSAETSVPNGKLQRETFIKMFRGQIPNRSRRPLTSQRSVEAHMNLAKELGMLQNAEETRIWQVTPVGRVFLTLWEERRKKLPRALVLNQILQKDRSFIIPFMQSILSRRNVDPRDASRFAWSELWKKYRNYLAVIEPPIRANLSDRTYKHCGEARLRLLISKEGLALDKGSLHRLASIEDKELGGEQFFTIGWILTGKKPNPLSKATLARKITSTFMLFSKLAYISAYATYAYINEKSLPRYATGWGDIESVLRNRLEFSLHSSFGKGDFLYSLKEEVRGLTVV